MFVKKSKNVEEKLLAVDSRILEFQKKKDASAKDIERKKQDIGSLLATLAIEPNDKAEESLKLAKKSLERMTESFNDVSLQVGFLADHRKVLERELIEARLRDIPQEAEIAAETFNKILGECLSTMKVLKTYYGKLKAAEKSFLDLCNQHQDACSALGIVKGLELKVGLGELAFVGGPYSMSFQMPEFVSFLGNLEAYRLKVEGYEDFKRTNPNYEKDLAIVAKNDRKSGEINFTSQQGWKTYSPPSH